MGMLGEDQGLRDWDLLSLTWVRVGKSCRRMSMVRLLRSVIFPFSSVSDKISNS